MSKKIGRYKDCTHAGGPKSQPILLYNINRNTDCPLSPHLSIGRHGRGGRHHLVTLSATTVQRLGNAFDGRRHFESSGTQLWWLLRWLRRLWLLRLLDHVFGMVVNETSDSLPVGRWIARTAIGEARRWRQLVLGRARTYHWRPRVPPGRNRRHGRRSGRVRRLRIKNIKCVQRSIPVELKRKASHRVADFNGKRIIMRCRVFSLFTRTLFKHFVCNFF